MLELVIGNRNYSSWSLRAWLYLRESGVAFVESRIPMFTEAWAEWVRSYSPAGRVPVLIDGDLRIWDSMAIVEHVRESHAASVGWPENAASRAHARSVSAEMHSGFIALRSELPLNIRARRDPPAMSAACEVQVGRVCEIWEAARASQGGGGPWLFGEFSIADVFFAPVALRFVTYGIPVSGATSEFVEAVQGRASVKEWCALAEAESESIAFIDDLVPADESPLTIG